VCVCACVCVCVRLVVLFDVLLAVCVCVGHSLSLTFRKNTYRSLIGLTRNATGKS